MITVSSIITVLNAAVVALTPLQRLKAFVSRLGTSSIGDNWFVPAALVAVIILTVMLFTLSYIRTAQRRGVGRQLFTEYAGKSGLSGYESRILLAVARQAGLKRTEAIFTMADAFDQGVAKIVEEGLAKQGAEGSERLKTDLSTLREKLGFQKKPPAAISSPAKVRRLSSRQIPVGKKLHITRRKTRNLSDIETTVVKNDDVEFAVKLSMRIETAPGELWRVRYYFGASVWEFDTSVVSCSGDILVLNHSDDVRFVNRRRFLRVPVNRPAFVARFPFARTVLSGDRIKAGSRAVAASANAACWGPPEFVPAVVTELAGPGLRIEVPLGVKVGERVLIVFKLNEIENQAADSHRAGKPGPVRIVEDIGEVRHTRPVENGFSIAVELTGLDDSDVNELIRATNAASLLAKAENQGVPDSYGDKNSAEDELQHLVTSRGL